MRRIPIHILCAVLIAGVLCCALQCNAFAFARNATSKELIEYGEAFNNQQIVFTGEVVGDIMKRGDFSWVNISDGNAAIGIWMPREFVDEIVYIGSYKATGDTVKITGEFHRACKQHGGDVDIHAKTIEVVNEGERRQEEASPAKQKLSGILLGVLLCLGILNILKSRRVSK
ncbi:DNA-binding protein [Candidatus Omnitrophota bacterium]